MPPTQDQRLLEIRKKYGIPEQGFQPEAVQRSVDERLAELRAGRVKFQEQQSASSAGALFPAKTNEPPATAALKATGNVIPSAFNLGKTIFQMVFNPIDTAKNIGSTVIGAAEAGTKEVLKRTGFEEEVKNAPKSEDEQMFGNVKNALLQRYGSLEAAQRTFTNDPFAAGADVATILSGFGAGKLAAKSSLVPQVAKDVAGGAVLKSAQSNLKKVLAPTQQVTKQATQKIIPELAKRKVVAFTREGLQEKYLAKLDESGKAIEAELATIPEGTKVNIKPVLDSIENTKNQFIVKDTGVIGNQKAWQAADELQKTILAVAKDETSIPIESIRSLRQIWDKEIATSKGHLKDLSEASKLEIQKEATNAIRRELGKEFPNLDKLNKEYYLWKTATDVLGETIKRKTGQTGLNEKLVSGGGVLTGIPAGVEAAIIGGAVAFGLFKLFTSTAWRTVSAAQKAKIADALVTGNPAKIKSAVTPILVAQGIDIEQEAEAKIKEK